MRERNPPAEAVELPAIEASPTKEFFISMLVKDIELIPAVSDLVDNCVDGALRVREGPRFDGYWVRLEFDREHFRIADNCGGMPVDVAQHYAFRFGRPEEMTPTPHSVGQFGVGMKRALFKLGGQFEILSSTARSRFTMDVNVEGWRRKPEWEFEFASLDEGLDVSPDEQGTTITVISLHPNVAKDFELENFAGRLRAELERRHQQTMEQGLAISVNGVPLNVNVVDLLQSDELLPAFDELSFNGTADSVVVAKIWAGISESLPRDAGWYVFCNGRLVLGPDQTIVTGWGEGEGKLIPKYHNQFARFRGYVFFDSDQASRLPWNTTKTGVDLDSDIYRHTRQRMLTLMRPVIDFLNKLDAEGEGGGPLGRSVSAARSSPVAEVKAAATFTAPKATLRPRNVGMGNILYQKPKAEIERVQAALKVTTYRDVGEKTFDYFVENELID